MRAPRVRVVRSRLTSAVAPDHVEEDAASKAAAPKKPAARRTALTVEALEELGAKKLAVLLMDLAENDAVIARSLRLALASRDGAGRLASEVEKRLRTVQRARGFLEWDKVKPLARELDGLRQIIVGELAGSDPHAAVAQMRLLLSLAEPVIERSDDSSDSLGQTFHDVATDLGALWALLPNRNPAALAEELLQIMDADGYGLTNSLLNAAGPALGQEGRTALRRKLEARLAGFPRGRERTDYGEGRGRFTTSLRLRQLADLDEDVDAYIAATEAGGRAENFADEIARRLLAFNRPGEALIWLDRAKAANPDRHQDLIGQHLELRIEALDMLGRKEEAQALRWDAFRQWLSVPHLRAYLRGLSDFADVEAEDQAVAHALAHTSRELALSFLVTWPNLVAANQLVREHHGDLHGNVYTILRPAAEALAEKYPAAATLLHRHLAEDVLRRASSKQYQYAARDVLACVRLAPFLTAEQGLETHSAFMTRIKREHARKFGFWSLLPTDIVT